jgi:hypothetical protein
MKIECVCSLSEIANILDIGWPASDEEDEDGSFMDLSQDNQVQSNLYDENSAGSEDESETSGDGEATANRDEGCLDISDSEDHGYSSDNGNGEVCIRLSNGGDESESESESGDESESEAEDDLGQSDMELSESKEEIAREMQRLRALSGILACKDV